MYAKKDTGLPGLRERGGRGREWSIEEMVFLKLHVLMMLWWFSNDLMFVERVLCYRDWSVNGQLRRR